MTDHLPATVPAAARVPAEIAERGISAEAWNTLRQSLYPRASDAMLMQVLDYCRARGLDPVKKPVHIVRTFDHDARDYIEAIWEGIGSHRITAARTGVFAGIDQPEFGPTITERYGQTPVTHPEWCRVTVYRIVSGGRYGFTSSLFWREAYSRKRDGAPTSMWARRPFAMLAKCAEAEALRKAFPEELGSRLTAEEVGGDNDLAPARPTTAGGVLIEGGSKLDQLEARLGIMADVMAGDDIKTPGESPPGGAPAGPPPVAGAELTGGANGTKPAASPAASTLPLVDLMGEIVRDFPRTKSGAMDFLDELYLMTAGAADRGETPAKVVERHLRSVTFLAESKDEFIRDQALGLLAMMQG